MAGAGFASPEKGRGGNLGGNLGGVDGALLASKRAVSPKWVSPAMAPAASEVGELYEIDLG